MIIHRKSTPYYSQCNGQAESTNKVLCNILTKNCEFVKINWQDKLNATLWAYHTTLMDSTGPPMT